MLINIIAFEHHFLLIFIQYLGSVGKNVGTLNSSTTTNNQSSKWVTKNGVSTNVAKLPAKKEDYNSANYINDWPSLNEVSEVCIYYIHFISIS